ncbi:MAG: dockerin type I domain-containing protein, partial [Planctomycetota bacterium]
MASLMLIPDHDRPVVVFAAFALWAISLTSVACAQDTSLLDSVRCSRSGFPYYLDDENYIVVLNLSGMSVPSFGIEFRSDKGLLEFVDASPFSFAFSPSSNFVPKADPNGIRLGVVTRFGTKYLGDPLDEDLQFTIKPAIDFSAQMPIGDGDTVDDPNRPIPTFPLATGCEVPTGLFGNEERDLGDIDGNAAVDAMDIDLVAGAILDGSQDKRFDLNEDGKVTEADYAFWVSEIARTKFGDANLDGAAGLDDFLTLANNFGTEGGW